MAEGQDNWRSTAAEIWVILNGLAAQHKQERAENEKRLEAAEKRLEAAEKRLEAAEKRLEAAEKRLEATEKQTKVLEQSSLRTEQLVMKVCRQLGRQDSRWGKVIESLVEGDLCALLGDVFGIDIVETSRRVAINNKAEIDIVAVNTDTVVAAEVKTTLQRSDIDKFISTKLSRFTELRPRYLGCKVYGVIAFVKIDNNAQDIINHALQQGLIVIRSMRGTNSIVNPKGHKPHNFHP